MAKNKKGGSGGAARHTGPSTAPPAPTHNRCGICRSQYPKGEYQILDSRLQVMVVVKGCQQNHEKMRQALVRHLRMTGRDEQRHGLPLHLGTLQKMRRQWERGQ